VYPQFFLGWVFGCDVPATGDVLMKTGGSDRDHVLTKRGERRVFLFITVFLFPALSVILVGGYGLLIWLLQLLFGPPGAG